MQLSFGIRCKVIPYLGKSLADACFSSESPFWRGSPCPIAMFPALSHYFWGSHPDNEIAQVHLSSKYSPAFWPE